MATFTGTAGPDLIRGFETDIGGNTLDPAAPDVIYGGGGNDYIVGSGGDTIFGGAGSDRLAYSAEGPVTSFGQSGDDSVQGSFSADSLFGGAGMDSIWGYDGNDSLSGGLGNDWLLGGSGDDTLAGGDGNDTLISIFGADLFYGGEGDDVIGAYQSSSVIYGGIGNDTIAADGTVYGGAGTDEFELSFGTAASFEQAADWLSGIPGVSAPGHSDVFIADYEGGEVIEFWEGSLFTTVSDASYDAERDVTRFTATSGRLDPITVEVSGSYEVINVGHGDTADGRLAQLTLTANTDPVASDVTGEMDEDAPAQLFDVLASVEDSTLTVEAFGDGLTETLSISEIHNVTGGAARIVDGQIEFTPTADFNGTASVDYTVTDGIGGFDTATLNIEVTPVNDAPVLGAETATTDEDVSVLIDVLGNDSDVDGDTLIISEIGSVSGGTAVIEDGQIRFTPEDDFFGAASVSYTVTDGNGGDVAGTLNIEVTPVNDAPVLMVEDGLLSEEGEAVFLFEDLFADVEGDDVTVTATSDQGSVEVLDDRMIFTLAEGEDGPASIDVTLTDAGGITSNGTIDLAEVEVDTGTTTEADDDDDDGGFAWLPILAVLGGIAAYAANGGGVGF